MTQTLPKDIDLRPHSASEDKYIIYYLELHRWLLPVPRHFQSIYGTNRTLDQASMKRQPIQRSEAFQ
jgi:hypothetical protein